MGVYPLLNVYPWRVVVWHHLHRVCHPGLRPFPLLLCTLALASPQDETLPSEDQIDFVGSADYVSPEVLRDQVRPNALG